MHHLSHPVTPDSKTKGPERLTSFERKGWQSELLSELKTEVFSEYQEKESNSDCHPFGSKEVNRSGPFVFESGVTGCDK